MTRTPDSQNDAYIEKAEPFAQRILRHLRQLVKVAVPDAAETTKCGMPFFDYHGVLCGMASFKQHATFTLWMASLIPEVAAHYGDQSDQAMGTFGRIHSLDELPDDARIIDWIRQAADLDVRNIKLPQRTRQANRSEAALPDDLVSALDQNEAARLAIVGFAPGRRREYVEWIEGAKTAATRQKRLATTITQLMESKSRHLTYQKRRETSPIK